MLARRIIEHCLEYFVLDTCPKITLRDCANDTIITLNDHFKADILVKQETATFKAKKVKFRIDHFVVNAGSDADHALHFCANLRSVKAEPLAGKIPNLPVPIHDPDSGKSLTYLGYVSGEFLDERVASERTQFDIADDPADLFPEELSWPDLVQQALDIAKQFLEPYTEPLRKAKLAQIQQFVQTKAPEYRPAVKHCPELLESVPHGLPEDKLDLELYKVGQVYDARLRTRYQDELASGEKAALSLAERKQRFEAFLQEWNEAGMAKLARHVAHRKATLALLQDRLQLQDDRRYALEEGVHEIVFPLRCTSDDVRPDGMNLWILDERLAYHYYLASDKKFSQVDAVEVDHEKRPDLLIFGNPFAFADTLPPFGSIVLVEFKRPARDDYTDEENPIVQVYEYVRLIKAGKARDRVGRPITVPEHLPYFAYVVCDLTPKLIAQAEDYDFTKRPDSQGFIGFNQKLGLYTEIISFDGMVSDAKKRNARFFDELGLGRD